MPGMACRALSEKEMVAVCLALKGRRNRAMFMFGCYTGFRINEILSAKLGDVINPDGLADEISLLETKTGKRRAVLITEQLRVLLAPWIDEMKKRGFVTKTVPLFCKSNGQKMSYEQARLILKAAYFRARVYGRVSTHTMRKTFGHEVFKAFKLLAQGGYEGSIIKQVQNLMGHADAASTMHYLPSADEAGKNVMIERGEKILITEEMINA